MSICQECIYNLSFANLPSGIPSPVVNLTVARGQPIIASWATPLTSPVIITHFLVEWHRIDPDGRVDARAEHCAANVTDVAPSNRFTFPHTNDSDHLHITIRSASGPDVDHTSIPVYYNMHDERRQSHLSPTNAVSMPPSEHQRTLNRAHAILIGGTLSALLVAASIGFIVWHRGRIAAKRRSDQLRTVSGDAAAAAATRLWLSGLNGEASAITAVATNTTSSDNVHEMQTLISGRPLDLTNGEYYVLPSSQNGSMVGNGDCQPLSVPLFTSTPAKMPTNDGSALLQRSELTGDYDNDGDDDHETATNSNTVDISKSVLPNNNVVIGGVHDSSRRPLFDESVTPDVDVADRDRLDRRRQQQLGGRCLSIASDKMTTRFGVLNGGQQRPLVGPNG